jgi:4-hydroxy-4-methyl-2-oxoglutarate aldolase
MSRSNTSIYRDVPRVNPALLACLQGLTVADLHDVLLPTMNRAGLLSRSIHPLSAGLRVCGPAVTAFCEPGDGLMSHCGLFLARAGDVLVISNGGLVDGAVWGGNLSLDAKVLGLAGVIIDGAVRDVAYIRDLQLPLWASAIAVSPTGKAGRGFVNMPLSCGGRMVNPGDIIVADDDGIVVLPPEQIESIGAQARTKLQNEVDLRHRINRGERLFDTQNFSKLLQDQGIEIRDGHWQPGDGDAS